MLLTKEEFEYELCGNAQRTDGNQGWATKLLEHNSTLDDNYAKLRDENAKLKAQLKATEGKLKTTKEGLRDKEISYAAVMSILKYYLDFFDALNPDAETFEKAMKKLNNKK